MPNTAPELELDAYLRLNRASIAEWLAAIRELSGCDDIDCSLFEGSGHQVGALTTLTTERGRLICLYAAEGMEITGCRATEPVFLLPRAGNPEIATRDEPAETAKFKLSAGVRVFADDGTEVVPGSGVTGRIATSGLVPLGYYKDPEKSAATFKEIEGVRYSFPGDYASVEADGSITLLGRGSNCINTAGEKVYPEEVEEAIKRHPDIVDCLVVGLKDERFGQRIVARGRATDRLCA